MGTPRILFLTDCLPNARKPLQGISEWRLVDALGRLCEVSVLLAGSPAPEEPPRSFSIRYAPWRSEGLPTSLGYYASFSRTVGSAFRQMRAKADVVLAGRAWPAGAYAATRCGKAAVTSLATGSDLNVDAREHLPRWLMRRRLPRLAAVFAKGEALADLVRDLGVGEDRIEKVGYGVDPERFRLRSKDEARAALGVPDDQPVILFVGNLVKVKDPLLLLEAVASEAGPIHAQVWFIGVGPYQEILRRRIAGTPFETKVQFLGEQSGDALPLRYAAADVLCIPSRAEGFPNVFLESLACGRPVVATAVGELPHLMREGGDVGLLAPRRDARELGRALSVALRRTWDASRLRAFATRYTCEAAAKAIAGRCGELAGRCNY